MTKRTFILILSVFLMFQGKPLQAAGSEEMQISLFAVHKDTGETVEGVLPCDVCYTEDGTSCVWEEEQTCSFDGGVTHLTTSLSELVDDFPETLSMKITLTIDGKDEVFDAPLGTAPWAVKALGLAPSGVTAGTYTNATITVNEGGVITAASSGEAGTGGDITAVNAGTGLTGGGVSGDVTIAIASDGISAAAIAANAVGASEIADGAVGAAEIASSGVTAGTYGSATLVPQFTVDADGRLTGAASVTITGTAPGGAAGGDLTGTYPSPTIAADAVALTTDTTGNYVATITAGAGLTGDGTTEGSTPTLVVGAGTGITVNADDVAVNTAAAFSWTGAHTFNTDADFSFADTENLAITTSLDSTDANDALTVSMTNATTSGTQRGFVVTNQDSTGTTDSLVTLDNADADTAVTDGITITSAAGGITDAIDASDADLVNAINVGANTILGTTGLIDFTNFDFDASGNLLLRAQADLRLEDDAGGEYVAHEAGAGTTTYTVRWPAAVGTANQVLSISSVAAGVATMGFATSSTDAPTNATYITQTANGTLTAEQALGDLATGYMKVTTTTGVVSSQATPIPVGDGGTGAATFTDGGVLFGNAGGAIQASAVLTEGQLLIGDGTTEPAIAAMSSDATIASTGVLTIAANAVAMATDTTGNFVGTITAGTGIATTGAASGENIAHELSVDQSFAPSWTGAHTFNTDVNLTMAGSEDVALTSSVTTDTAVNPFSAVMTHNVADTTTQNIVLIRNADDAAASAGTLESLLALDNADANETVTDGMVITSAAGGAITDAIDASDADLVNAINIGANNIIANDGADKTISASELILLDGQTVFGDITGITAGNGLTGTATSGAATLDVGAGSGISAAADAIALGALTADWNQTGAFDISLNNASSELKILESLGGAFFGTLDMGDLSADATYTFTGATGNVYTDQTDPLDTIAEWRTLCTDCVESTDVGADSVALTTDTTGNYVATITAGTGITGSSAVEGGTPTIAVDQDTSFSWTNTHTYSLAGTELMRLNAASGYTGTPGVIDLDAAAGNAAVVGIDVAMTQNDGATAGTDVIAQKITLTGNDGDGDLFGITITAANAANAIAGTYEAGIKIDNADATDSSMTDAILITSSGVARGMVDAVDASDSNIENALNAGSNDILGTTARILFNNFQVDGNTGDISLDDSDDSTITFAAADATNSPMIQMFIGTGNSDRMVIAHSASFTGWGMSYDDGTDGFSFSNTGPSDTTPTLFIDLSPIAVGIGTNAPGEELDVEGQIQFDINTTGDTTIGVCKSLADGSTDVEFVECSGTPSDIAEWYETTGAAGAADIMAATDEVLTYEADKTDPRTGLILGPETLTTTILRKSSRAYDPKVIGIVSTSPVQTYGKGLMDEAENEQPIAITGRVPVKVVAENGPIAPGDPITSSSVSGVGMKAVSSGMIVGYALDAWNGPGQGLIMASVHPGWWGGGADEIDEMKELKARQEELEKTISDLQEQVRQLKELVQSSQIFAAPQN